MRKMTVKQKLIGMTIILSIMVAGLSIFFIERFNTVGKTYEKIVEMRFPQYAVAGAMSQVLLNARINMNELCGVERNIEAFTQFVQRSQERLSSYQALGQAMVDGSSDLGKQAQDLQGMAIPPCRKGGEIEEGTKKADGLFKEYRDISNTIIAKKKEQLELVNAVGWYDNKENSKGVVKTLVETAREMEGLDSTQEVKLLVGELRKQEKNILQRADTRYISRLKQVHEQLDTLTDGKIKTLANSYYNAFETIFDKVLKLAQINDELKTLSRVDLREKQKVLTEAVAALKARAREQMVTYSQEAISTANSARTLIIFISTAVVLLSLLVGWFISGGVNSVLKRIILNLNEGSDQVASASGQVSAASQSLAEGTSEQAASIEETSSSLEEMSSMTKQNAEHANQANTLMREANSIVGKANESMKELTGSMEEISRASEETSKIVKTIDEIAFQTNLLALNAAVEAARAGEAGAGFAVVADEVRNLAMRAAEAAKNTSNLIESTVKKIGEGSDVLTKTNEAFSGVDRSASKVGELVAEIAAASNEQSQGIDEINKAMSEIDKVTQQNAANAEESASAAEEMSAQAEQMNGVVAELEALVGGKGNSGRALNRGRNNAKIEKKDGYLKIDAANVKNRKPALAHAKEVSPVEVIPMDGEEYKDF